MPLVKPQAQPGFNSQATQVQAAMTWFAGNLVRWRNGLLEKMSGWRRLTQDPFVAIVRRMHAWLDLDNRKNLLVATDLGVQLVVQDTTYSIGAQITLEAGDTTFNATLGSTEVEVVTSVLAKEGDAFVLQLPISVGGRILPPGVFYTVTGVIPGGFTFDMPIAALANETGTIGVRKFNNDALNKMTVTWKAHGLSIGQSIEFAQATSLKVGATGVWEQVNFSAPAGSVVFIDTVPTADTFTFEMGSFGTGDGTGGPSHEVLDGSQIENGSGIKGPVIGLSSLTPLGNPQRMNWFLDNLGQNGLMLHTGGPLEVFTPPVEDGTWTDVVETAPQRSNGMFVAMPQAQVILLGSEAIIGSGDIDPLLIRWSNVGTYDEWIATVSNQAGSYRLSRGSKIVGGIQAPQTTLVVTDTDIWGMSYIGPPLIYGFTVMGSKCGLLAPLGIISLGRSTYWVGDKSFWQFGDGGVQPLPCSVYDFIFDDLDTVNVRKIHAAANSTTYEVAWFFPSLRTAIADEAQDNLLFYSQQLSQWSHIGVVAGPDLRFRRLYVYEPQYVITGWFDDIGLMPFAWWNDDIQGEREKVIFAPDGTDTSSLLREFPTNGMHAVSQSIAKLGRRTSYTFSVYAHNTSTRNITLRAKSNFGSAYATFNPVTGQVVATGVTSPTFAVVTARVIFDEPFTTNGWRRYYLSFTSDDAPDLELFINLTNVTEINYLGDTTQFALLWGAQLVHGLEPLEYHPSFGTQEQNECTKYVKYNTVEKVWDSGTLPRSAWIDTNVWGTPLGADPNTKLIQQHEQGFDDDDQPMRGVFAETGYIELGDGSVMLSIDQVQPDFKWFGRDGEVRVTLKTTNYPGGPVQNHERYSMTPGTQFFSPRARARYAALRYEWSAFKGFSARVGATTFRVKPAGRRP